MLSISLRAGCVLLGSTVLLVAGCGTTPVPTRAAQTATASVEALRAYNIEAMLGIGPSYGDKLREAGVTNTDKLLAATATTYKRHKLADTTGIPYKLVLAWAQKVAVMGIDGIGPRQANLLAAVGVDSIQELAHRDADNLWERVATANAFKPHFVANTPSRDTVAKWIAAAKKGASDTAND